MERSIAERIFLLATVAMLAIYSGTQLAHAAPLRIESTQTPEIRRTAPLPQTSGSQLEATTLAPAQTAQVIFGPNLIQNPSVESAGSGGAPAHWLRGGYGTNARTLTYPAIPAADGAKAVSATISSYTSGDAKWYFENVPVRPGEMYEYSDFYLSDVPSEVNVQYTLVNGTNAYAVLGKPGATSVYQKFTAQFTVPANVVSLTVFHVIKSAGTLTTDNFSLNQLTQNAGSSNLVMNGDFEISNGALPSGWAKGGYGTNSRTHSYPVTGNGGGKAARVSITSYTSGDAKWYFTPLSLSPGAYIYRDDYQSNVPSIVTIQIHNADGSYTYTNIGNRPASPSAFTSQSLNFVVPEGARDITIFHLIKQVGTLTLDNVVVEANPNASGVFVNGAVTLTFDDGWLSQYQNAVPVLNNNGFKATFYIVSRRTADDNFPGFMSKAQIRNLFAMGHEIASHTQTHRMLTQLSDAEQWQEINGSRQDLLAMNIGPINAFAYPFGDYSQTSINYVKQAGFKSARSTIDGYAVPASDHYQLPRRVVRNTTTVSEMAGWVNQAIAQKTWLIIAFHRVDTSGDAYAITPADFSQFIDYVKQRGVLVVTMDQGIGDLNPQS